MRNIVVIAYLLHYSKGSEFSVAWNYVKNMSRNNKLIVIYGSCNGHHNIGNTGEMEEWSSKNSLNNVTFVPIKPSHKTHNFDYSIWGQYRFYKEYRLWHKDVRFYVEELIRRQKIDIIHYLGPIGYREPGFLYDLPVPYIRGPIGGMGGVDLKMLKATGSLNLAMHYFLKRTLNEIQCRFSLRVIRSFRDSDVVICATSEQKDIVNSVICKKHHSTVLFRQENCLERIYELNEEKFNTEEIRLIFIGSIDGRKGLPLVIEGLRGIPSNSKLLLDVVGDGPARKDLERQAQLKGVAHFIRWHGKVPRERVFEMLRDAHLMVLPSLMEANSTVILEAMSQGVPSLTLCNCGFRDTVTNDVGFSIPIKSYRQVVSDISNALNIIIADPHILREKANKVVEDRKRYLWEDRMAFFESAYLLAEKQYNKRQSI